MNQRIWLALALSFALAACGGSATPEAQSPDNTEAPASAGAACGGLDGATCAEGEFCDFPIEAQCGAADQQGVCRALTQACTREYAPVCGCDDTTYPTACVANSSGVSVRAEGPCPEPAL